MSEGYSTLTLLPFLLALSSPLPFPTLPFLRYLSYVTFPTLPFLRYLSYVTFPTLPFLTLPFFYSSASLWSSLIIPCQQSVDKYFECKDVFLFVIIGLRDVDNPSYFHTILNSSNKHCINGCINTTCQHFVYSRLKQGFSTLSHSKAVPTLDTFYKTVPTLAMPHCATLI